LHTLIEYSVIHCTVHPSIPLKNGAIVVSYGIPESVKVLRSGPYNGRVSHAFTLCQDVSEAAAQAKYSNGVLELTLQKKTAVKSKSLNIE